VLGDVVADEDDLNIEPAVENRDVGEEMGETGIVGIVTLVDGIVVFRRREAPDAEGVRPSKAAPTIRTNDKPVNGDRAAHRTVCAFRPVTYIGTRMNAPIVARPPLSIVIRLALKSPA